MTAAYVEEAGDQARNIGSGKEADGYDDRKLANRQEINLRNRRRSRRGKKA